MDKAEYRIRTDEIKDLINEREYEEAAAAADEIDWRRVKSVKMLCTVSDLYKINRRFDDAKNILLIAYNRNPHSRTILYALCDLSIRLKELLDALDYYGAYVKVAPGDPGRYVLQYRLYRAQGVSIEERISVLEALKKEEYTERWGYELALLYHRCGRADECVAECNEVILWFGEGKYVTKAMELKMLHEPLTQSQQYLYERRGVGRTSEGDEDRTPEQSRDVSDGQREEEASYDAAGREISGDSVSRAAYVPDGLSVPEQASAYLGDAAPAEEEEIRVKTVDVENKYSTMNLQRELAESLRALLGEARKPAPAPEPVQEPLQEQESAVEEEVLFEQETEETAVSRFDTKEVLSLADIPREKVVEIYREPVVLKEEPEALAQPPRLSQPQAEEAVEPVHIMEVQHTGQEQDTMIDMTRMEGDGQIGMILPEPVSLEKQITGQLNLEDVLAEWERRNLELEEERRNQIYERIKEQTGDIFAEFDARKKEDILEERQEPADEESGVYEEAEFAHEEEPVLTYEEESEYAYEEDSSWPEEPELSDLPLYAQEEEDVAEPVVEDAAEDVAEDAAEAVAEETAPLQRETVPERYRRYIHSDDGMREIRSALQNARMPIGAGNLVVEGDNYDYCFEFIRQLLTDLKDRGMRFSGKLARISAINLNRKKTVQIFDTLEGGAMVIERISMLSAEKMQDIENALRGGDRNLLLILVDTPEALRNLRARRPDFMEYFPLRVNMQGMSAKELVQYGSAYAYSEEYVIDEMALLALQTRIEDEEAGDHVPMPEDVEKMVNAAIRHANRIGMRKFITTLTGSRYNEEDMIILKEQDFA